MHRLCPWFTSFRVPSYWSRLATLFRLERSNGGLYQRRHLSTGLLLASRGTWRLRLRRLRRLLLLLLLHVRPYLRLRLRQLMRQPVLTPCAASPLLVWSLGTHRRWGPCGGYVYGHVPVRDAALPRLPGLLPAPGTRTVFCRALGPRDLCLPRLHLDLGGDPVSSGDQSRRPRGTGNRPLSSPCVQLPRPASTGRLVPLLAAGPRLCLQLLVSPLLTIPPSSGFSPSVGLAAPRALLLHRNLAPPGWGSIPPSPVFSPSVGLAAPRALLLHRYLAPPGWGS